MKINSRLCSDLNVCFIHKSIQVTLYLKINQEIVKLNKRVKCIK